ncbi:MAG: amidase [Hyphomicrobiales bacterium]
MFGSVYNTFNELTATHARSLLISGELTPDVLVSSCRERIENREDDVEAWQHLDWLNVERQLSTLSQQPIEKRGLLWGLPVSIKDIFDTFDMPTSYGSKIYAGFRPVADAACVSRLRAAGAIIMGKSVSTEFAYWQAGKTKHPNDAARSPGGSSSGSAAAVSDYMVPLAIGSQTAASTIRPAAYCGIVGYKPTRGMISLAGVKALANGLDTVGMFGRCVSDIALIASVMANRPDLACIAPIKEEPNVRLWMGPEWDKASKGANLAIEKTLQLIVEKGAHVGRDTVPDPFTQLCEAQTIIMAVEAARELSHERYTAYDKLSMSLHELFALADGTVSSDYDDAYQLRDYCLHNLEQIFGDADVLVLPSAPDVAPLSQAGTGDPVMSRAWTLLGLPSITVPCGTNASGLSYGIQLAARPRRDVQLLQVAKWFEDALVGQKNEVIAS